MPKASWNGAVIAESDSCVEVEGNCYFPRGAVKMEYLEESATTSVCPWKGMANYYNVIVNGETNKDAAWYYPDPKEAAESMRDHVAFWRGVEVED
jgi:uncharacterized protein (DUF427 family)